MSESGLPESSLGLTDVASLQRDGQQNCFPPARTQHSQRERAARGNRADQMEISASELPLLLLLLFRIVIITIIKTIIIIIIISSGAALAQLVSIVGAENRLCPGVAGGPRSEIPAG